MRMPIALVVVLLASFVSAAAQQAPSLTVERELFLSGGGGQSMSWSPDGRVLAVGGDCGEVVLLDAATGERLRVLEASDHWTGRLCFSPDGERLAVAGRSVTLWEVASGRRLAEAASGNPSALDWSRDGAFLAAVQGNRSAALLAGDDLEVTRTFDLPDGTAADSIAIDAAGERVAVGKRSGKTYVFSVATGERVGLHEQPDWVHGLAWLDDGRLLRLGWKGTLRGYGEEDLPVGASGFRLHSSRDGGNVVVTTSKQVVWFRDGAERWRVDGGGVVAPHPDGERWARLHDGRIDVLRGRDVLRTFPSPCRQPPGDAVLTGDGRYAVVIGERWAGGSAQVFDVATGARVEVDGFPQDGVLVANPQGTEVVLLQSAEQERGEDQWDLRFWAIDPGEPRRARLVRTIELRLDHRTANSDLSEPWLSPDLKLLGHGDQLLDLEDDARSRRPDMLLLNETVAAGGGRFAVSRLAMHSSLAGAPGFGEVLVFAREHGGEPVGKRRFDAAPRDLSVSPDGATVAACVGDVVGLFAVPELAEQQRCDWSWFDALWLDDRHLLGATHDGRVQIGDRRTGDVVAEAAVGSWARRMVFNRDRGVALIAGENRAFVVRIRLP